MQWKLDAAGNIIVFPLAGWSTAVVPGHVLVALEHVTTEAALETGERERIQLAMTNAQAIELARALLAASDPKTREGVAGHA